MQNSHNMKISFALYLALIFIFKKKTYDAIYYSYTILRVFPNKTIKYPLFIQEIRKNT